MLRAPLRHRALAAAALAACLALGVVLILIMPVKYQVQTVVLTQRSLLMSSLTNPGMNREWDVPTRSAREVVIRRENIVALAKQVDFVGRHMASRAPVVRARDWVVERFSSTARTPELLLEVMVDTLQDRLQISTGAEGTVTISFEWANRELALDVVQAALQIFLEERHVAEVEAVGESIAIFEEHDAKVQKEIATTVAKVEVKERALQVRTSPRPPPVAPPRAESGELARLEATLAARRRALADLELFRQQRLAEMQAQLAQQQTIYAPSHPTLASTKLVIDGLSQPSPQRQALQAEITQLESEVARRGGQASLAPAVASTLEADMAAARLRLLQMADPRLELERRQLEDLLREHSNLLERIDAARLEMDTALAAFKYRYTVVSPPQLPRRPARPYTLIYLVGGLLGGLAAAFGVALLADLIGGRVVEKWQLEESVGIEVLGELHRLPEAPRPRSLRGP
ncbi:MAG: hypothetical protein IPO09_19565 [Anaeromyxobacter sp.]|nr:hypothetical protein [Anaeromyxobacter sp.]MBL0275920.1 hypothetical protein [Anaeromyxobacter sp.]